MNNTHRENMYLLQTGRKELTPKQARRLHHKENVEASDRVRAGVGRYGRLARRYDKKDNRRLRREGFNFVAWVRWRRTKNGKDPKS